MRVGVALLVVLSAALAGCTDASDNKDDTVNDDAGDAPFAPVGFPVDNTGSGCREGFVVSLVSFEQAAKSLPAGFRPADASGLFDAPVAAGSAAAFFTVYGCSESAYANDTLLAGDYGIFVEAPTVNGTEPSAQNFYVLATHTENQAVVAALNTTGSLYHAVAPSVSVNILPTGSAVAEGTITDHEGVVVTYSITAPAPNTFTTTARFWHGTPAGLLYTEYVLDGDPISLGSASCTVRAGSMLAEMLGRTECPPDETMALTLNDASWDSKLVFLPGARAEA